MTGLVTELRGFYNVAKSQFQTQLTKMADSEDTGLEHAYYILEFSSLTIKMLLLLW